MRSTVAPLNSQPFFSHIFFDNEFERAILSCERDSDIFADIHNSHTLGCGMIYPIVNRCRL